MAFLTFLLSFGGQRVLKLGILGVFFQVLGDVGAGSGVDGASPEVFGAGQAILRRRSGHFASQVRVFS